MAKKTTIAELRKMQVQDLRSEIRAQEKLLCKLRLAVKMLKEKDTARYRSEKKQFARLRTVLAEKQAEALRGKGAERTVGTPKEAAAAASVSPRKRS